MALANGVACGYCVVKAPISERQSCKTTATIGSNLLLFPPHCEMRSYRLISAVNDENTQQLFHKSGFVVLPHAQWRVIKSPWHMAVSRRILMTRNDTA